MRIDNTKKYTRFYIHRTVSHKRESGHITSKIVRFVVESYGKEVLHVYEVQFPFYPGANNEIIYSGGFRQINVDEKEQLSSINLKQRMKRMLF
ncbi:hypothetical protein [Lysinibacillus fusiformis]|uniref:Uncharacterized protein n=1 Tax=Lysinibacillus fusiformis TaxID=28031 RepID=A0A1E4R6K4_9BACI|nr:hypothetical protein [Lysinibacillus fusiformis]ODV55998.1 hypothetical protein BG258_08825 [Lysinibacillus fusiformis]